MQLLVRDPSRFFIQVEHETEYLKLASINMKINFFPKGHSKTSNFTFIDSPDNIIRLRGTSKQV